MNFKFNAEHTFFTSDTHFNHANIIGFCNRPFKDVEQMNETLIANWNSIIGADDTVFHLGDFCLGGTAEWTKVLDRLNGKIYLILGNHDLKNIRQGFISRFEHVAMQMFIEVGKQKIYLNHNPFLCYGGAYKDIWQLFGHVHSGPFNTGKDKPRLNMLFPMQYDVGVDISLHIEIRKQNQWHLMTVTSPQWEKTDHEYEIFNTEVFNCRYYHFRDFLNEADTHKSRNKDILSEELQKLISDDDYDMGFGVFMFSDIVHYCDKLEKKLLSGIAHAGIYSIKEQLNRIEAKLDNDSSVESAAEEQHELYEDVTPIEQMYEDFMWDYGLLFRFRDTVQALMSFGYNYINESDVRIFYLVC